MDRSIIGIRLFAGYWIRPVFMRVSDTDDQQNAIFIDLVDHQVRPDRVNSNWRG